MSRTDINTSSSRSVGATGLMASYNKYGQRTSVYVQNSPANSYSVNSEAVSRSGVVTANFGGRKRKTRLPCNNFSFNLTRRKSFIGLYEYRSKAAVDGSYMRQWGSGSLEAFIGFAFDNSSRAPLNASANFQSAIDDALNRANLACLRDIKSSSANFALMFAERQKTVDLVAFAARRLALSYRALRRGDFASFSSELGLSTTAAADRNYRKKHRKSPSKAAASAWLEHRYGWMPLLQDVDDACRFLATGLRRPVYGSASGSSTVRRNLETKFSVGGYPFMNHEVAMVSAKTKVFYSVSQETLSNLSRTGITNPLNLAWELLPYSFVVDWFLPVGSWLETLDATYGASFADGFSTTFVDYNLVCYGLGTQSIAGDTYTATGAGSLKRIACQRRKLSSFPSASFPSFKDPTSVTHMVSALALLRVAFGR